MGGGWGALGGRYVPWGGHWPHTGPVWPHCPHLLGDGAKWGKARGSGSLGGIWGLRAPYGDGA